MALGPINIPPLQERNPIVDAERRPVSSFVRALNKAFKTLADAISGVIQAQQTADAAQVSADTAQTTAVSAQTTADSAQATADDALSQVATKQPLDAALTALSGLPATAGVIEQTGADVFTIRAIGAASATDLLTRADGDSRYAGSGTGVTSFNTRTGAVTLTSGDVTTALGFTPISGNQNITLSGDVSGSGTTAITTTLATVNSNVGSFGSATQVGTFTVNGKGLITAAANVTVTPAVGSITGLGTGVATALGVNVGSAGAFVTFNGAGGTPSSLTLTNATGLPIAGGGTGASTASGARTNLDLIIGTSGNAVPKLNGGATTWAAGMTIGGTIDVTGLVTTSGASATININARDATNGWLQFVTSSILNFYSNSANRFVMAAASFSGATDVVASLGTSALRWLSAYIQALYTGIRTITATASVANSDYTILCNATSGAITVNLPAASGVAGRILNVKKIDASANTVTLDGNASETIDGATTKVISTQWTSITIQCDGSAWYIL